MSRGFNNEVRPGQEHPRRSRGHQTPGSNQGWQGWRPDRYRYMPDHFFSDGVLREELVTTQAYEWAEKFRPKLTSAQMRRFYNEVKALEARIESEGFDTNLPLVRLLESKVAYACPERGDKKIPPAFAEFLWKNLACVRSKKEFEAFVKVFEAVVGFYYHLEGR